jgi:hypothetical protein
MRRKLPGGPEFAATEDRLRDRERLLGLGHVVDPKDLRSRGKGEVAEEPRGMGLQRAVGELLGCQYCLGQWFSAAIGRRPRHTLHAGGMRR